MRMEPHDMSPRVRKGLGGEGQVWDRERNDWKRACSEALDSSSKVKRPDPGCIDTDTRDYQGLESAIR